MVITKLDSFLNLLLCTRYQDGAQRLGPFERFGGDKEMWDMQVKERLKWVSVLPRFLIEFVLRFTLNHLLSTNLSGSLH